MGHAVTEVQERFLLPWASLVILGGLALGPDALAEQAAAEVEIDAEIMEIDREAGEARFSGAVRLRHGELELCCDQLTARVSDEGRLQFITATGAVRITASGLRATAGSATYGPGAGRLSLRGTPSVRSSGGVLSGRVITIDVGTGRVVIEEAHGVFRLR